ncbi:hypothetical protein AB0N23_26655, partial [Streptomyces sp. NPDC052644]
MAGPHRLTSEPGPSRLPAWAGLAGAATLALALFLPGAAPPAPPDQGAVPAGSAPAGPAAAAAPAPPGTRSVPRPVGRLPSAPDAHAGARGGGLP